VCQGLMARDLWPSGLLGFGGGVVSGLACFATRQPPKDFVSVS